MATESRKLSRKRLRSIDMDGLESTSKVINTVESTKKPMNAVKDSYTSSQDLLSLFTDCMSALSTNKICSRNAFDVEIIDHMNDLVQLEGESDDDMMDEDEMGYGMSTSELNKNKRLSFTRASKVVEGASRIYGYRVEAIYDKAYNVLMNMNNASNQDVNENIPTKSRIRNRKIEFTDGSKTLYSESDVTLNELPVDNTILDPYFLKVSSMFDQSGAQGLLLTNLLISSDLKLSLDGNDVIYSNIDVKIDGGSNVYIDGKLLRSLVIKGGQEYNKLEILPELHYYRNELQKLLNELNKKSQGGGTTERSDEGLVNEDMGLYGEGGSLPEVDGGLFDIPELPLDSLDEHPTLNAHTPFQFDDGNDDTLHDEIQLSLRDRMEAIDVMGGSEFSYYKSDIKLRRKLVDRGLLDLRRKDEKKAHRRVILNDIKLYMDNLLSDELNSIELMDNIPINKNSVKKPNNILISDDYTTFKYRFNNNFFNTFNILSNKSMKFNNYNKWKLIESEFNTNPILEIHYIDDPDSLYLYKYNMNWSDEKSDGESGDDYNYDDLNNIQDIIDEPMNISIDQLYENDINNIIDNNLITSPTNKDIIPATSSSFIDIFKIKKTLCTILLPTNEFQEAFENENDLIQSKNTPHQNEQTQITFQNAITNTVNKLTNTEYNSINSHLMFVCLLHVCNEQNLLLKQNTPLQDFHICSNAPKEQHL